MEFIRSLFITIVLLVHLTTEAAASDRLSWMDRSMSSLGNDVFPPIEVPVFGGINQGKHSLNLDDSGVWVSTGTRVQGGKLLQIEWLTKGVLPKPSKYRVLYRIDPRFSVPQVFIQKLDFSTKKYVSDFHQFKEGQLLRYQDTAEMDFRQRVKDYNDFFHFNGRAKIEVKKDDVINITMDTTGNFFGADSEMTKELSAKIGAELLSIYTSTSLDNNNILYSSAVQFCNSYIISSSYDEYCKKAPDKYWDVNATWSTYIGKINQKAVSSTKWNNTQVCPDSASGMDSDPPCKYDLGRGMVLSIGGTEIKSATEKFISSSSIVRKDFFYHKSDVSGSLEFKTPWNIDGMYNTTDQLMEDWSNSSKALDYYDFYQYMTSLKPSLVMDYIYMGRYLMEIEIGNSVIVVVSDDVKDLQVEYYISDKETPDSETVGISVEEKFRGNASSDGYLWLRVINPNPNITGSIQVTSANYTGTTLFSDVVYKGVIKPLRAKFNELSEVIYRKLVSNAALQNISRSLLSIYIIIYGLMFLAGAVQITVSDLITRVVKISIVVALFSETSWTFFSRNLFDVFVNGTDYLMTTVIGVTSSAGNVFGFIDPVIEKYTNGDMWALLFIQLLQIKTGLTFFAIMTIYSVLLFFRAVLQVVVGYCLAFVGLAVMISLAPFFIMLILFEHTKGMFDKWISTMFSQMLQPTLLLIFVLLIDQIMGEIITRTIIRAEWGLLFPIKISLDLNHMSIPMSFSFTLPFFDGFYFYIPQTQDITSMSHYFPDSTSAGSIAVITTSSFLFFALSKVSNGLVDYVTAIVGMLGGVTPALQDRKKQQNLNPINDIINNDMGNMVKPITGAAKRIGGFAKEKLFDQKISKSNRATKDDGGDIDYGSAKRSDGKSNKAGFGSKKPTKPIKTTKPTKTRSTYDGKPVVGVPSNKKPVVKATPLTDRDNSNVSDVSGISNNSIVQPNAGATSMSAARAGIQKQKKQPTLISAQLSQDDPAWKPQVVFGTPSNKEPVVSATPVIDDSNQAPNAPPQIYSQKESQSDIQAPENDKGIRTIFTEPPKKKTTKGPTGDDD